MFAECFEAPLWAVPQLRSSETEEACSTVLGANQLGISRQVWLF